MESQSSIADSETELEGEFVDPSDSDLFLELDLDDSASSTPYASAHSSPGRAGPVSSFFYSAPASPMHFAANTKNPKPSFPASDFNHSFEFEFDFDFSARSGSNGSTASMCSADELFHNGKIRPMKVLPLAPLLDDGIVEELVRGRDVRVRDKLLQRRRTRSMSPLRSENGIIEIMEKVEATTTASATTTTTTDSISACSSSRSSSAGRSSKRWVFLKDFVYRSKSEGRSNTNFWSNISFAGPLKEKKSPNLLMGKTKKKKKKAKKLGRPISPHERHYTANRAHSEEMKKKTYLPYRQGLLGCLGFTSKGYGYGFAKAAFNSVSSR